MRKFMRANVVVSLLLLAAGVISTGCQAVHVKDKEGQAIAFANVSSGVQGSKFASTSTIADAFGNAFLLMRNTEGQKQWVAVSKEGYISRRLLRATDEKIEVTLQKTTSSGLRYKRSRAVTSNGMSDRTGLIRPSLSQGTPPNNAKVTVPRK